MKNSYYNLMKNKTERIWIQQNKDIHLLNYWFYRYFTKRYYKFLLEHFKENLNEKENEK